MSEAQWAEPPDTEDATNSNNTLRERAYALKYDPDSVPPPDETCMIIGDIPIAARGNLTGIQGKSKVGKSAVISAILAALQRGDMRLNGDTLGLSWVGEGDGAIIHLDTEQSPSDWHSLVTRSIARSGCVSVSPRLISLPLVRFAISDRMTILRQTMIFENESQGSIAGVLIDGGADLCKSPNDEAEALQLISDLLALAHEFNCAIIFVLHENPGTKEGKTRGHLGSELNRKAFANLRIDKDSETSISTIYGTDMRKREIPKAHGFCFGWDEDLEMHTFIGRVGGLQEAARMAKAEAKTRAEWEAIFETAVAESGTRKGCPDLSPEEAFNIVKDSIGTKKTNTVSAVKKRMQRAEFIGVLIKTEPGRWSLNLPGQPGQQRDILDVSPREPGQD